MVRLGLSLMQKIYIEKEVILSLQEFPYSNGDVFFVRCCFFPGLMKKKKKGGEL